MKSALVFLLQGLSVVAALIVLGLVLFVLWALGGPVFAGAVFLAGLVLAVLVIRTARRRPA